MSAMMMDFVWEPFRAISQKHLTHLLTVGLTDSRIDKLTNSWPFVHLDVEAKNRSCCIPIPIHHTKQQTIIAKPNLEYFAMMTFLLTCKSTRFSRSAREFSVRVYGRLISAVGAPSWRVKTCNCGRSERESQFNILTMQQRINLHRLSSDNRRSLFNSHVMGDDTGARVWDLS
jgi:hypothetical protein